LYGSLIPTAVGAIPHSVIDGQLSVKMVSDIVRVETMTHRMKIKVYYEDTDAGGVVYYGRYLGYLERARTELLAEHGVIVSDYHREGIYFVVVRVEIDYRKPARLGEIVEVTTEVTETRNASMILKQQVLRQDALLVDALVTFACIDQKGKPIRLPANLKGIGTA
jgi:acyl-CoA thioester hydrolase